jgi:hypothetical protein
MTRAHLVVGGFPAGATAAHDMDYARLRLLSLLDETPDVQSTVSSDFVDLERWLADCGLLVSYVAGPHLQAGQNEVVEEWLAGGGRWLALHGTSGGRAGRIEGEPDARRMQKLPHHETLGSFFLNHPPIRRFRVDVADAGHPIVQGLPASFETSDELYFIELLDRENTKVLLTTELPEDPAPGFGFSFDSDTSLFPDGKTRALGYTREVGEGGVTYIALGHCHSPSTNGQPFVDKSVDPEGKTPLLFRGSWETPAFQQLLANGIAWGAGR